MSDGCGSTVTCGPSCWSGSTRPALHTSGRYLQDENGHNVILRGVNTISIGHIVGPKSGSPWFPLSVEAYVDAFTSPAWPTRAVRMLFNSFPSSDVDRDAGADPSSLPWYPVPFTYAPATLPPAWQPNHAYSVGDRVYSYTLVWRCTTAGTSAASGGPRWVGSDISDGSVHWTVENPTVITDADWNAYASAVLFRAVDYAISKGLYVAVCLFDFSDPATVPSLQDRHASFWGRLSRSKYAGHPQVLFDLHNEIERADNWSAVKPLLQQTVDMIRANGANNVILVPSPGWAASTDIATGSPLSGSNLAYTMHRYRAYWDADLDAHTLPALRSGAPVFVSEMGDDPQTYSYWRTYAVGDFTWEDGVWYRSLQGATTQGANPTWTPRTYAVGEKVWSDAALWQVVTGGASTAAPTGNGRDRGQSIDDLTLDGVVHWKCLSNRDHDPASSPAWWQVSTTGDPWFATTFLGTMEPSHGAAYPPVGLLAWSVSSDWSPGLFTTNQLTTPNAYGLEVQQWLLDTQSLDLPH
jgi:hypothetical protein